MKKISLKLLAQRVLIFTSLILVMHYLLTSFNLRSGINTKIPWTFFVLSLCTTVLFSAHELYNWMFLFRESGQKNVRTFFHNLWEIFELSVVHRFFANEDTDEQGTYKRSRQLFSRIQKGIDVSPTLSAFKRQLIKVNDAITSCIEGLLDNRRSIIFTVIIGVLIRIFLLEKLPVSNDEGYYLYDGYLIKQGFVPLRDFLTKSLPHIYFLSLFSQFGNYLIIGRFSTVIIFVINSLVLLKITQRIFPTKSYIPALVALTVYSLYPEIVSITSYLHTQELQNLFMLCFAFVIIENSIHRYVKAPLLAGLFTVSYLTRPSSVVLLIAMFAYYGYCSISEKKLKLYFWHLFRIGIWLAIFNTAFILYAATQYSLFRVLDNMYGIQIITLTNSQTELLGTMDKVIVFLKSIGNVLNMFALRPLYVLAIYAALAAVFARFRKSLSYFFAAILFVWLMRYYVFSHSYVFFFTQYLEALISLFLVLIIGVTKDTYSQKAKNTRYYVFLLLWLGAYIFIYSIWIKFRAPYFSEAFSLISLLAGSFAFMILNMSKKYRSYFYALLIIGTYVISARILFNSYTGQFTPQFVYKISRVIMQETKPEDTVLSASLIFPFEAQRKIPLNISHPIWYSYKDFNQDILKRYIPTFSTFEAHILKNPPKMIVYDDATLDAYFKDSPKLQTLIKEKYKRVATFIETVRAVERKVILYKYEN